MSGQLPGSCQATSHSLPEKTRGIRVEAVRVNQRPIMCRRSARQCIARLIRLRSTLHPPPGSGDFASRILRAEHFHGENMDGKKAAILSANLFTLPGLHFDSAVLMVFLRQDESLDSPSSLESAQAGSIMPSNPIIGQANACLRESVPQL
jgi:hypothetical protein